MPMPPENPWMSPLTKSENERASIHQRRRNRPRALQNHPRRGASICLPKLKTNPKKGNQHQPRMIYPRKGCISICPPDPETSFLCGASPLPHVQKDSSARECRSEEITMSEGLPWHSESSRHKCSTSGINVGFLFSIAA